MDMPVGVPFDNLFEEIKGAVLDVINLVHKGIQPMAAITSV